MVGRRAGRRDWRWSPSVESRLHATTLYAAARVGRGGLVGCRARRRGWRLWRGADSDCAQRPYTRLHGSAGAGWSGAAWDSAAGGCGGARNANCAQRPYTRLCGPAGRDGRGPRGTARQAVGRSAKCGLRATTLYGVCGWAASQLGGASRKAWLSALASHGMRTSSRPYTRVCGSTDPRYWAPLRSAGPAVVARRRMQVSCNDPIQGHPRRAGGQNGLVPGPLARGVGYRFSTLRSRVGDGWRTSEKLRRARMPHNVVRWRELRAIPPPRRPTIRRRAPVARSQRSAGHGRDADARGMVASGRRMCRSAEPGPRRPRPPRRRLRRRCP